MHINTPVQARRRAWANRATGWRLFALAGWICATSAYGCTGASCSVDFTLAGAGSRTVTQGLSTVFLVTAKILSGTDQEAYVDVAGLPQGTTVEWPVLSTHCCGTYAWRLTARQPVSIHVS